MWTRPIVSTEAYLQKEKKKIKIISYSRIRLKEATENNVTTKFNTWHDKDISEENKKENDEGKYILEVFLTR